MSRDTIAGLVTYPRQPYPPAPWDLNCWSVWSIASIDRELPLPAELVKLGDWIILTLVRYTSGTLVYDEMSVASLVRQPQSLRFGIWSHHLWVNSLPSLWGGREIWGVPKNIAEFLWTDNQVALYDEVGLIMRLNFQTSRNHLPFAAIFHAFGRLPDRQAVFTLATLGITSRLGAAQLEVRDWSDRFPFEISKIHASFGVSPMHLRVLPPKPLDWQFT